MLLLIEKNVGRSGTNRKRPSYQLLAPFYEGTVKPPNICAYMCNTSSCDLQGSGDRLLAHLYYFSMISLIEKQTADRQNKIFDFIHAISAIKVCIMRWICDSRDLKCLLLWFDQIQH